MIRLFRVSIPGNIIALVLSEAVLIFTCYVLATYWVLDVSAEVFLIDDGGLWHIALVDAVLLAGLYLNNLYTTTTGCAPRVLVGPAVLCSSGRRISAAGLVETMEAGISSCCLNRIA